MTEKGPFSSELDNQFLLNVIANFSQPDTPSKITVEIPMVWAIEHQLRLDAHFGVNWKEKQKIWLRERRLFGIRGNSSAEEYRMLEQIRAQFTEREYQVLALEYGFSLDGQHRPTRADIAAELGMSISTVGRSRRTARAKLLDILSESSSYTG